MIATMTSIIISDRFSDAGAELDGWTYRPSPHIEPDSRSGFDIDGNYHAPELPRSVAFAR